MKNKYLNLLIIPLFLLCGCDDNSSGSSTTTSEEQIKIDVELAKLTSKMDEIPYYGNTIQYKQTQNDNYGALDIVATQIGKAVLYNDDFYHDDFTQQIDDEEPYSGITEKGITKYQNVDVFYRTKFFDSDSDNNSTALYSYSEELKNQFFEIDFKSHFVNNFINLSYNLYTNNPSNSFILESNLLDLDFSKDGKANIKYNFKMYQGSSIAIEINSNDTITISNKHITNTISNYYISMMDATNYQSAHLEATYSFDETITTYKGEKLNPLDYYKESN